MTSVTGKTVDTTSVHVDTTSQYLDEAKIDFLSSTMPCVTVFESGVLEHKSTYITFVVVTDGDDKVFCPIEYSHDACTGVDSFIRYDGSSHQALFNMCKRVDPYAGGEEAVSAVLFIESIGVEESLRLSRSGESKSKYYEYCRTNLVLSREGIVNQHFLDFLLAEEEGRARICSLSYPSLVTVLTLCKKGEIEIKDHVADELLRGFHKEARIDFFELLTELSPNVFQRCQDLLESIFVFSMRNSPPNEGLARFMATQMEKYGITPSEPMVAWYRRILEDNVDFTADEFNDSSIQDYQRSQIYEIANRLGKINMVRRLKECGVGQTVESPTRGIAICSPDMDIVDIERTVVSFFNELRENGQLLTHEEFEELDTKHWGKQFDIGRILGTRFVEQVVRENGYVHVKVPKKKIVMKKGENTISWSLSKHLEVTAESRNFSVQAEHVEAVKRKISVEEAVELMHVLIKTGFGDFAGVNVLVGEDGLYIIDTEFSNFNPQRPLFDAIKSLVSSYLDKTDHERFHAALDEAKQAFNKDSALKLQNISQQTRAFSTKVL